MPSRRSFLLHPLVVQFVEPRIRWSSTRDQYHRSIFRIVLTFVASFVCCWIDIYHASNHADDGIDDNLVAMDESNFTLENTLAISIDKYVVNRVI